MYFGDAINAITVEVESGAKADSSPVSRAGVDKT
jgi:hypothetical protein